MRPDRTKALRVGLLLLALGAALGAAAAVGFITGRLSAPTPVAPSPAPPPATDAAATGESEDRAALVRVVDGDTVVLAWRPAEALVERVRLLNVDTPERGHPGYDEATAFVRRRLAGARTIRLEFEDHRPTRDAYGRVLAYIHVDGVNLNVEIVRAGWSRYYDKYGPGRYPDAFRRAEDEARRHRRGLWALEGAAGGRG